VPPHNISHKITEKEGVDFEKKLGEWVIEIIQTQMDKHATADRDTNT